MDETVVQQAAALAAQLSAYVPPTQASTLGGVLASLRAGQLDPVAAQTQFASNNTLLEVVHRLAARAVTLRIEGSALGILFKKDAQLRGATITIGDVARRTANGEDSYHAVFQLPPVPARPLVCQPTYVLDEAPAGREREMREMADLLEPRAPTAPPPVVLVGSAGIGKRYLAAACAQKMRANFAGGVFWLRMSSKSSPEDIALQVASCGGPGALDLPGWPAMRFAERVAAVQAAWREPVARLLVLEDVEDVGQLTRWLPQGGGCRVLITTTGGALAVGRVLRIGPLPRSASLLLLLSGYARSLATTPSALLGEETNAQLAGAVCDALEYIPLALVMAAGALTVAATRLPLPAYLGKLSQTLRDNADKLDELRAALPTSRTREIGSALLLNLELLRTNATTGEAALTLLQRSARCAPFALPGHLLSPLVDANNGSDGEQAATALQVLQQLGMVSVAEEHGWLHPTLAAMLRALSPTTNVAVALEQALIAAANLVHTTQQYWNNIALVPHMAHSAQVTAHGDDQTATLLLNLGYMLQNLGDLPRARPHYERALAICEEMLGENHTATARVLANLGRLAQEQGDYSAAQRYLARALAISEHTGGVQHPTTARAALRLGALYEAQGQYAAARANYERALAINEHVYGPEHPDTASVLITLGHLLQVSEDLSEARSLYERALAVCRKTLGANHPATARCLHGLGYLCELQGDMATARQCYEEALAIRERVLGPQHPDTAYSLHTLGYLLHVQEQLPQARPYYEQALAIRERVLGPQHPDTARTLNNLGHIEQALGDLEAAQRFYERALAICLPTLGPGHASTQAIQANLEDVEALLAQRAAQPPE